MGRLFLPNFDGSTKRSTRAWVEKLDVYFQLNQMAKVEAIKISTLHFAGEARDWWFHGLTNMGHEGVTTYEELAWRVLEHFERKYLEEHYRELTQLKQTDSAETYISEFLRIFVMVPNLSEAKRVFLFL